MILSISALAVATVMNGQVTERQTATLIHGNKTSVFYGMNAFVSAHDAAADSADVIILSPGIFNQTTVKKSISIYGAGMEDDAETGGKKTSFNDDFWISPVEKYNEFGDKYMKHQNGVHIEGIDFSDHDIKVVEGAPIYDLEVVKCGGIYTMVMSAPSVNTLIRQCRTSWITGRDKSHENFRVYNCYVNYYLYGMLLTNTVFVDHCMIGKQGTTYQPSSIAYYTNNIIYDRIEAQSTAYNNIFAGSSSGILTPNTSEGNWFSVPDEGIYAVEGEDGSYSPTKTYEIKYPARYVGTDGTVVGLQGGKYPWNIIPSTPRILSSNIDTTTSADGKLKVNITVEAQTKE